MLRLRPAQVYISPLFVVYFTMTTKRSFSDIPGSQEALQLVVNALSPHYKFPHGITTSWTLMLHGSDDLQLEGRLADSSERYADIPRQLREWPYLIVTARTGTLSGVSPDEKNPVIYATSEGVVIDMQNDPTTHRILKERPLNMLPSYQWTLEVQYTPSATSPTPAPQTTGQ